MLLKTEKRTYVNKEYYLLNPYLLTVLVSIPFNKLLRNFSNSSVRKVIQELKPVGNDTIIAGSSITNSCQNQKQTKSALPRDEVQQPTSPTKSYLTQFPVVKGQQKKLDPKLGLRISSPSLLFFETSSKLGSNLTCFYYINCF